MDVCVWQPRMNTNDGAIRRADAGDSRTYAHEDRDEDRERREGGRMRMKISGTGGQGGTAGGPPGCRERLRASVGGERGRAPPSPHTGALNTMDTRVTAGTAMALEVAALEGQLEFLVVAARQQAAMQRGWERLVRQRGAPPRRLTKKTRQITSDSYLCSRGQASSTRMGRWRPTTSSPWRSWRWRRSWRRWKGAGGVH